MSPFYAVPWPVLLTSGAAVVLLGLACYLAGFAEGEAVARGEDSWLRRRERERGGGGDDPGNWRW